MMPVQPRRNAERRRWAVRIAVCAMAADAALALGVTMSASAQSSKPIVYPSRGQSLSQQSTDEGECHVWAKQQTGFDPAYAPQYSQPQSGYTGHTVRGAARGAALGAVGGAIGGDAGKGAAIGAGVGATAGLLGRRRDRIAQEEANTQAQSNYSAGLAQFNRAFSSCMQGRGYTVN